jgi:hypothetical protein
MRPAGINPPAHSDDTLRRAGGPDTLDEGVGTDKLFGDAVTIGLRGTVRTWRLRRRPGQVAASQQHRGDVRNHVAPDRRTLARRMQGHARRFRQVIRGAEPAHARCEATAGEGPSSASREAATKVVASAPCFCRARQRRGPARPRVPDWSARTRVLRSFAGLSCADAIVPVGRRRR